MLYGSRVCGSGKMPDSTWSALGMSTAGNTRPGQSHSMNWSLRMMVCRCLVLPGVAETPTHARPMMAFIRLLFPALGCPSTPVTQRETSRHTHVKIRTMK